MTRAQEIFKLRRQSASFKSRRMHKAANGVNARLVPLVTKQLKVEMRK